MGMRFLVAAPIPRHLKIRPDWEPDMLVLRKLKGRREYGLLGLFFNGSCVKVKFVKSMVGWTRQRMVALCKDYAAFLKIGVWLRDAQEQKDVLVFEEGKDFTSYQEVRLFVRSQLSVNV